MSVSEPQFPHPTIRVALGVHTGAARQEHAPQLQVLEHVCVPNVLHACAAPMAQVPCPAQLPLTHVQLILHVSVSVPQLPQASIRVPPGVHMPVQPLHWPLIQVWPCPVGPQVVPFPTLLHADVLAEG